MFIIVREDDQKESNMKKCFVLYVCSLSFALSYLIVDIDGTDLLSIHCHIYKRISSTKEITFMIIAIDNFLFLPLSVLPLTDRWRQMSHCRQKLRHDLSSSTHNTWIELEMVPYRHLMKGANIHISSHFNPPLQCHHRTSEEREWTFNILAFIERFLLSSHQVGLNDTLWSNYSTHTSFCK